MDFSSLCSPGSSSIKWVCLEKKSFHLSEGQHAEHFCWERVSRFCFPTWVFTAPAILKAKYVTVWFFCFPPWKSLYFDELFHYIADSHLLNTHPFPLSCPCFPLLITALEMGLVPLLQRFFHAVWSRQHWHSKAGMFFSDSSSQWRAKLSLVFLHGRVIFWWLIV